MQIHTNTNMHVCVNKGEEQETGNMLFVSAFGTSVIAQHRRTH